MARTKKAEAKDTKNLSKATVHDFDTIIEPVLTEKTMKLMQEDKVEIKKAFENIFGVKVIGVNIVNVRSTSTTRGGRYKGTIPGFKKAVVTIAEGEALDLFKE